LQSAPVGHVTGIPPPDEPPLEPPLSSPKRPLLLPLPPLEPLEPPPSAKRLLLPFPPQPEVDPKLSAKPTAKRLETTTGIRRMESSENQSSS